MFCHESVAESSAVTGAFALAASLESAESAMLSAIGQTIPARSRTAVASRRGPPADRPGFRLAYSHAVAAASRARSARRSWSSPSACGPRPFDSSRRNLSLTGTARPENTRSPASRSMCRW